MAEEASISKFPPQAAPDFQSIVEALDSVIIVLDADNRLRYANAAAEDFFGLSRKALLAEELSALLPAECALLSLVARVRDEPGALSQRDLPFPFLRAKEQRGDVRVVPLPGQGEMRAGKPLDQAPKQVVVSILPVGFGARIGRLLDGQAQDDKTSGMSAILAHEVKNPLAGIRGAAQLLSRQIEEERRHLPELIIGECDRITALVDRMELLGSRGLGSTEPINIHEVLGHVSSLVEARAGEGLAIQHQFDPSLPKLMGDRGLLIQCFLNLLQNAVEAAPEANGLLKITSSYRPGLSIRQRQGGPSLPLPLEIIISDNGPGVAEQDRERIFEPFVTAKKGGTGLGLALVRRIVAAHGGLVACEPSREGGRFRILLPISQAADQATRDGQMPGQNPS